MTVTPLRGHNRAKPLKPNPDRERVIAAMLERYHDLALPEGGTPGDRSDDRILTRQHDKGCAWAVTGRDCTCWVASMDELTRCLHTMRKLRKQRALAYTRHVAGEDRVETADIGVIYQHVRWWYLDVTYRSAPVTRLVRKNGRVTEQPTYHRETGRPMLRLVAVRHPDARAEKAAAGLTFLAHLFRGEPRVPGDVVKLLQAAS